jgi:hypothetical protein
MGAAGSIHPNGEISEIANKFYFTAYFYIPENIITIADIIAAKKTLEMILQNELEKYKTSTMARMYATCGLWYFDEIFHRAAELDPHADYNFNVSNYNYYILIL